MKKPHTPKEFTLRQQIRDNLAHNVKVLRKAKNLSYSELANGSKMDIEALAKINRKNANIPSLITLIKLSRFFDVSLDDLTLTKLDM